MRLTNGFHFETAIKDRRLALLFQPRVSSDSSKLIGMDAYVCHRIEDVSWEIMPVGMDHSPQQLDLLWKWTLDQLRHTLGLMKQNHAGALVDKPNFYIALHLMPGQLGSDEWSLQLVDLINRLEIPGACIEVVLSGPIDASERSVLELSFEYVRHAGVRMVLDNFAVAESSFLYLAEHKFDKVKFGKGLMPSIVDSVSVWAKKREVLNALSVAAKSIGANVVLSGMDREAHFNFFREVPVNEWQGEFCGGIVEFSEIRNRIGAVCCA